MRAALAPLVLLGCSSGGDPLDAPLGSTASSGATGDTATVTLPERDWGAVTAALDAMVDDGRLRGFSFAVRVGEPDPAFVHAGGFLDHDSLVPTDSSIKPVTGLIALSLVDDERLALDDTLGSVLGWDGPEAAVTVEQLLAFTSGFDGSAGCLSPPPSLTDAGQLIERPDRASLADCAAEIRAGGLLDDPGTAFHYGGSHQALLARVVEVALGDDFEGFEGLLAARVRSGLGLSADDLRYSNNRVAGSAVATAAGMSRVYEALAMDLGVLARDAATPRLLSSALTTSFVTDRTGPGVDRTDTPWRLVPDVDLAFGLGIWLDCPEAAASPEGCRLVGSGANGSTSWIDVPGGYAATLALYEGSLAGFVDGYAAMEELAPLVRTALAP